MILVFLGTLVSHSHAAPIEEHDIVFNLPIVKTSAAASLETLSFADYSGKLIYLDFWASWCVPCLQSMPFLNRLRNREHHRGFEVIAVNLDKDIAVARQIVV
jgi:thiol-disulfide isomerase/thioredoxin